MRIQPARGVDRSLVSLIGEGNRVQFPFFFHFRRRDFAISGHKTADCERGHCRPIDSGRQEEKNGEAGYSEPFYVVYGGKVKNAGKMLVIGMIGFLSAGLLLSGCKSAPELTKANALALIQAKYDQTPAAGVAIAVDVQGLKDGVTAKYWEKATVYPNRIWGDFKVTADGMKVLKLSDGGSILKWRPDHDPDPNYAVVVTSMATSHLKAQDVQDPQDEVLPGAATAKGADFNEVVNLDSLPAPLVKIAHNAINKLVNKRHADFAFENGAWVLHSIE